MVEFVKKFNKICKSLNYKFKDLSLLKLALTHSSYSAEQEANNQRLEFLGDAILNAVISEHLYKLMPHVNEGDLTRIRSLLVKEDALAVIAKNLIIPEYLILGVGEQKTGGINKNSILADTLEAIIGAIYLDSDFLIVNNLVLSWYVGSKLYKDAIKLKDNTASKDAKTILQEFLQAKAIELPIYKVIKITGKPHNQKFTVECIVPGLDVKSTNIYGTGTSRKQAEQAAAKKILKLLCYSYC